MADEATLRAATDAAFPGLPAGMSLHEARRRVGAALAVAAARAGAVQPLRVAVELACGHRWVETRPVGLDPPRDGELRRCGAPVHPEVWEPATYHPAPADWRAWVTAGCPADVEMRGRWIPL